MDNEYQINKVFYEDLHYYYPELEQSVNAVIGQKFEQFFLSVIDLAMDEGPFETTFFPKLRCKVCWCFTGLPFGPKRLTGLVYRPRH